MFKAKEDMDIHIRQGWRVHICTMGCYAMGYSGVERIIVVYEK
jgi:hypothetical protein